ncbi:Exosome complex component RRP41 [Aphanomyces cochlioides]|nr:Exosome complex component RRP41 [Aphanomyces cochlioides]
MKEFVSVAGLRVDGRRAGEVRRIRAKFGLFQRVDGSAYVEQGQTKVMAVVYGPKEHTGRKQTEEVAQTKARVTCEVTQAPFATSERKVTHKADRKKLESSLAILQIFESTIATQLYPRSQIDIFVQVLHADGGTSPTLIFVMSYRFGIGELAASINAVTLALIDAGIAMKDFVVACSAGYIQQTLLCDLNYTEQSARCPDLTVAMTARNNKLSLVQMESKLPLELFDTLMKTAMDGCTQIYDILQNEVQENTWRRLISREK